MRRFTVLLLAFSLCLAACSAGQPQGRGETGAKRGDARRMIEMAVDRCYMEPEEDKGQKTLEWLHRANASGDAFTMLSAKEMLGYYYLAMFEVTPDDHDPAKDTPVPHCTGQKKMDGEKAVKWLKACIAADQDRMMGGCRVALGHYYFTVKDYAAAYFWYADELAWFHHARKPEKPAAIPLGKAVYAAKGSYLRDNARFARQAAQRLSKKEVAAVNERLIARLRAEERKEDRNFDREFERMLRRYEGDRNR